MNYTSKSKKGRVNKINLCSPHQLFMWTKAYQSCLCGFISLYYTFWFHLPLMIQFIFALYFTFLPRPTPFFWYMLHQDFQIWQAKMKVYEIFDFLFSSLFSFTTPRNKLQCPWNQDVKIIGLHSTYKHIIQMCTSFKHSLSDKSQGFCNAPMEKALQCIWFSIADLI